MSATRLKSLYKEEVVPALIKEYGYSSVMQTPKLEKVVINIGVGLRTSNIGFFTFIFLIDG